MAFNTSIMWEVRPTNGSDTNGGGWYINGTGTDFSQQNSPQYAVTDGVTNGTTTITSATASFGTDVVGNFIYVSGGTGSITAIRKQITSRTNSTTIVVDSSTGLTAGTGVTLNIGGALASLAPITSIYTNQNKIFIKRESGLTITASQTFSTGGAGISNSSYPVRIIGYNTTRGDAGRALITCSTNSGITALNITGSIIFAENIEIDCASLATSTGISISAQSRIINCKISNFTTAGITTASASANNAQQFIGNEITGGGSGATAAINHAAATTVALARYNYIHDNQCPGIIGGQGLVPDSNIVVNNTGASSDGIQISAGNSHSIKGNICYGNGRDGIRITGASSLTVSEVTNNILVSNGGYGITGFTSSGLPADINWDGNAFYNNTSGTRQNMDDTTGVNSYGTYTNVRDIILTGDPFTNAAGGNFTLNNTSGAGAAIRAHGIPSSITGATGTNYIDMGTFQHQDSGGSAGMLYFPGMSGGIEA